MTRSQKIVRINLCKKMSWVAFQNCCRSDLEGACVDKQRRRLRVGNEKVQWRILIPFFFSQKKLWNFPAVVNGMSWNLGLGPEFKS